MCGRFVQAQDPATYAEHFGAAPVENLETAAPSYNLAPTDRVLAVADHDGERRLGRFRWGLIPFWAKDLSIGNRHINARAESIATRPAFRDSFLAKRCLIPADGFFEWQQRAKGKLPHYIYRADASPLALAGLWASWRDSGTGERIVSCTIITTEPNQLVAAIHDRMPVVLPADGWDRWLDPGFGEVEALRAMLVPSVEAMAAHPVSTLVNSVRNNLPDCIAPLEGVPGDL
ncbi:MAG: SOS response-associated peptidase [Actinobacteria bacterium]|nr:SOS response-associated peptidase [Actinomycetota bacterium]